MKESEWELDKFLRSLFYLLHDTFARRTDFKEITGSDLFPLKFCNTRWVENRPVAQRGIDVLPNVTKYVKVTLQYTGKDKAKIPTCSSFKVVKETVLQDRLIRAKLEFFVYIAGLVEPFLTKFQSDEPLVVYLGEELMSLLTDLMELFIQPDVLAENSSAYKLANLDVADKKNQLSSTKVCIGNGAKAELSKCPVSELQKREFRAQCTDVVVAMVSKSKKGAH